MSPASRAAIALSFMAGFYVLAIGTGIALLALAWFLLLTKSAAGLKLAFFSAVAGGTVLLSLRPRIDRFEPPGPRLTREAQPELFGVIEDVARATNQAMPVEVFAVHDVNAWVSTRGGVLGIGGRRVMGLGIPLLHLLSVDELKAVLAHEFGHYGGGDTKVGRLVYHTRLGLGRTLEAVEGKSIAALFNLYGALVMRVSTAVARQQEFAADAFAARATSGRDLAASLRKLDQHGPLLPLFWASNLQPIIEEGYWAPIGRGFAEFCSLPTVSGIRLATPADDPSAEKADGAAVHDSRYDSHPPTAARVAALAELESGESRVPDTRVAGSLLRDQHQLEFDMFTPADEKARALKAVEWADVTPKVLIPRWQRVARERRDILARVHVEAPPAVHREIIQLGRTHGGLKMRLKDDAEVMHHVLFGIGCGVMSRLIEQGWTPVASPSLFCEFARGDERIDPMRRIQEIAFGAPADEWAAFCAKENLRGPLACN